MKKIYLLLLLFTVTLSCQKDEVQILPTQNNLKEPNQELIDFKNLPTSLLNKFDAENLVKNKAFKHNSPFGPVNTNVPAIKKKGENGTTSYTLKLKKTDGVHKLKAETDLYFDNLTINKKENGEEKTYIIRYLPNANWYYHEKGNFASYSGKIKIFDVEGNQLGKTQVKNGTDAAHPDIPNGKVTTCTFVLKNVLCVGDVNGGDSYSCVANYELDSCQIEDDGGSNENPTDPNINNYGSDPNEDGNESGGGANGDPTTDDDEVDTTPILAHCLITNTCEEQVKIIDSLSGKEKCLNSLLEKNGDSYVSSLLDNFKGESEFDIKILSKEHVYKYTDPSTEVNGQTYSPANGVVKIYINSSTALGRSALSVVRTLLHEYIHADIYRKLKTKNPTIGDLNFKQLFELYEEDHHEAMGNLYITSMKNALKAFHRDVLTSDYNKYINYFGHIPSDEFYEALAWQGLKQYKVDSYNKLSPEKKQNIENEELKLGLLSKECPNSN